MKKENIILTAGLISASLASISVFIPWTDFFTLTSLGNFGHFISNDFYNTFIGIVVIYFIVLNMKYRENRGVFLQGLIILAVLTVFHLSIKLIFGEWTPRPSGSSGGFPSGHSQAVFALSFLLSIRNRKLMIPAFLLSVLMAWSRIFSAHFDPTEAYEPAHYPYHVCFGSFFGIILTYLMYKYSEPIRLKKINRDKPEN